MASTAPTWSRPHRPGAGDVQLHGVYRQLVEEWIRMGELPSIPNNLRKWGASHPILKGVTGLPQMLDRIDESGPEETDEILVALITLAQGGQRLAGQVVLQAMLPKLSRFARSANMSGTDAGDLEDRRQIGLYTFLEVLAGYQVKRRPRGVASNLALDTLHAITEGTRATITEYPVTSASCAAGLDENDLLETYTDAADRRGDPTGDDVAAGMGDCPNPDGSLLEAVAWGVDTNAISREAAALLVRVYAPANGDAGGHAAAAAELGLKEDTVRQRCSRATRALATAVRAQADGSWMDSPAFA